jgi:hypothetical protein
MTVFFKNEANDNFKSFGTELKATYARSMVYVTKEKLQQTYRHH